MTAEPSILGQLSPGLFLFAGALLLPFLPGRVRAAWMLALPVIAFLLVLGLSHGSWGAVTIFDMPLVTLRVDGLSLAFAFVFLIALLIAAIYQLADGDRLQQTAAMIYAGSTVGAIFAGDLVTLFLFWEGTTIASVFLLWSQGTERAIGAGNRYLIFQIGSGLLLLAAVIIHFGETGSIAFESFDVETTTGLLLFLAFGIKAAFPLLHHWLKDAYPEASASGTVILSIFTTKMAIYALARGFAGTEILVPIGAIMVVFPIFWALIEADHRRVLSWALNSQLGFMVAGIGIGTELALNGAVAHALSSIIYQALLFMGVGAVLFRTGTAQGGGHGGLARHMPWTAAFYMVGAFSIAAFPLFSGFVSKSMILSAAGHENLFWPWVALLFGGAGAFVVAGLKIPLATFFGREDVGRAHMAPQEAPQEAPTPMLVAMGIAAALCVGIGIFPSVGYAIMPFEVDYVPYTLEHVVTQFQLLVFAALVYVLALRLGLVPTAGRGTALSSDWLYRVPGRWALRGVGAGSQALWAAFDGSVRDRAGRLVRVLSQQHGPEGALARTRPSGSMAFWMTVMLLAFLVFSFV